jgi:hypothetical protein
LAVLGLISSTDGDADVHGDTDRPRDVAPTGSGSGDPHFASSSDPRLRRDPDDVRD